MVAVGELYCDGSTEAIVIAVGAAVLPRGNDLLPSGARQREGRLAAAPQKRGIQTGRRRATSNCSDRWGVTAAHQRLSTSAVTTGKLLS